jgi:hypothetical protein
LKLIIHHAFVAVFFVAQATRSLVSIQAVVAAVAVGAIHFIVGKDGAERESV